MSQVPSAPKINVGTPAVQKPGAALTSYDKLPGMQRPLPITHLDALAVTATMASVRVALPSNCRVLEIGCAVGGNLLPMAQQYPGSTFLGIDTSFKQIASAQKTAAGAGLTNIKFEVMDVTTLGSELGQFDYIIANGIYSWVKPQVREQLLPTISRLLAPTGVAFVNYHVYPGWHGREMLREAIAVRVQGAGDTIEVVARAREFLNWFDRYAQSPAESPFASVIRNEARFLMSAPDDYLIHEYLEAFPVAIYFRQFAAQVAAVGLTYVGEVKSNPFRKKLIDDLRTERGQGADMLQIEEDADVVLGAYIRRSLICRDVQAPSPMPIMENLERLSARTLVIPTAMMGDLNSMDPMTFQFADGRTVQLTEPMVKVVLVALSRSWPQALPVERLFETMRNDLQCGPNFAMPGSAERQQILSTLVACFGAGVIDMHAQPATYVPYATDKPRATALARYQAREGKWVTNLIHNLIINLTKTDRLILAHLNGARDRTALIGVLKAAIAKGVLPNPDVDQIAAIEAGLQSDLEQVVEQSLTRLAAESFLEG